MTRQKEGRHGHWDAAGAPAIRAQGELEDLEQNRGRLKIFLGAARGVGKTYAMLQAAQERRAEGVDVVVGLVDTHGRPEMDSLLAGLASLTPMTEERSVGGVGELDLGAVLARRPALVLVDDLDQANPEGSRHAHRYQDVEEILDAQIDVYTTLNVEHLESLVDLVSGITGIVVRDSVPDSLLESADEVKLVDLPPADLLARLREGKVHVPDQTLIEVYEKGTLIALRELALRCASDWVDSRWNRFRQAQAVDRSRALAERVLVCIDATAAAVRTVRAGRRLARRLRAQWIVLYVETPGHLVSSSSGEDHAADALRVAERLGAETVVLSSDDPVEEIVDFASARNISKVVIGKSVGSGLPGWRFRRSFLDRLADRLRGIDVLVVHGDGHRRSDPPRRASRSFVPEIDWATYVGSVLSILICTVIAALMFRVLEPPNLIMIYLLGVVFVAARWGRGPSILAAILSVLAFDFFFVPPYLSLAVSESQYLVTFVVMACVALIISALTARVREHAEIARQRERRTSALYSLSKALASTQSRDAMIQAVCRHVEEVFKAPAAIVLTDEPTNTDRSEGGSSTVMDPKERAAARWALEHGVVTGSGTETLSGADAVYAPMIGGTEPIGVIALRLPSGRKRLDTGQMHLLETMANQAALAFERARLSARDMPRK